MNFLEPIEAVNDAEASEDGHNDDLQSLSIAGPTTESGSRFVRGTAVLFNSITAARCQSVRRYWMLLLIEQLLLSKVTVGHRQHADEEGEGCDDDLPRLAGAELPVRLEELPQGHESHLATWKRLVTRSHDDNDDDVEIRKF